MWHEIKAWCYLTTEFQFRPPPLFFSLWQSLYLEIGFPVALHPPALSYTAAFKRVCDAIKPICVPLQPFGYSSLSVFNGRLFCCEELISIPLLTCFNSYSNVLISSLPIFFTTQRIFAGVFSPDLLHSAVRPPLLPRCHPEWLKPLPPRWKNTGEWRSRADFSFHHPPSLEKQCGCPVRKQDLKFPHPQTHQDLVNNNNQTH